MQMNCGSQRDGVRIRRITPIRSRRSVPALLVRGPHLEVISELANRCRLGLAGCAHQTGWNIQLPGWPKSPCCGDGLASQIPKCLATEIDTVRVMGAASEGCISGFHHKASDSDAHMKTRAALRLNQRPFLTFFAIDKYDEIGLHLVGDSKCRLAVRDTV